MIKQISAKKEAELLTSEISFWRRGMTIERTIPNKSVADGRFPALHEACSSPNHLTLVGLFLSPSPESFGSSPPAAPTLGLGRANDPDYPPRGEVFGQISRTPSKNQFVFSRFCLEPDLPMIPLVG